MNVNEIIAALDLPSSSRVDERVPKKLLIGNGAPTTADKRHINEGIEEVVWVAALKPTTIGVPEYRDESREYLEVAVLQLTLRDGAKITRLVELVHRAIPYPVLLVTEQGKQAILSAVHKRWSQGETGKTVLDGELVSAQCDAEKDKELWPSFHDALKLDRQPRVNLHALYQGWINTLLAWNAARMKGKFTVAVNDEHAAIREEALRECARLNSEIARLRASAKKERQVAKQVELNLELKRVEAQLAKTKERL
jgi:hypothetical protein